MAYRVEFTPTAAKELVKLQKPDRKKVARWVDRLAENPRRGKTKKLAGRDDLYRVHAGDSLVIAYRIDDKANLILVARVGERENFYTRLPDSKMLKAFIAGLMEEGPAAKTTKKRRAPPPR
ncbi:MAG: type II toxin-antitoxin system RelE/ParE family toxin [Phycisphaerae bacterium]|nr:type II toxin-antitoxin system RelE/ParE family toxin [Phycisphaerae bacterium]